MNILFITTEHPASLYGGLGAFTREFTRELRKYCNVKTVYLHLTNKPLPECDGDIDYVLTPERKFVVNSLDGAILENAASFRSQLEPVFKTFNPDIIHCNDRQTYLPFRFQKNVVYSSHLLYCDMLGIANIDNTYFHELKVEQCALNNADIVVGYSRFAWKRIKHVAPTCYPISAPLGFNADAFYEKKDSNVLNVAYFGRFENRQKGFMNFIHAVSILGEEYLKSKNVRVCLYGNGEIHPDVDTSAFSRVEFLQGKKLYRAYAETHIMVMPSKYEPFGLTGIEAMASGCLLLCTEGLGMDEYAVNGKTCINIPRDPPGIAKVLKEVIDNFKKYKPIAKAGKLAVRGWTWKRCVLAHLDIYRQLMQGRTSNLRLAASSESAAVLMEFENADESARTRYNASLASFYKENIEQGKNLKETLVIIAGDVSEVIAQNSAHIISTTAFNPKGLRHTLECLFFDKDAYEQVVVFGAWEMTVKPEIALSELLRITAKSLTIYFKTGDSLLWQTVQMESVNDWEELLANYEYPDWKITSYKNDIPECAGYGLVEFEKNNG
ncbi:glycosyltransferase [Brucepastera parasyntrophica]|uniref:glycosyltransferase family 4 protein n=1 Tax=Brucepastera parasyntrophica TaxID=2880008 RepID=UPI002109DA01|nr:glycosyltransferase [Brucepastera parasyntrophica]ULQ60273.1 glycosyltransferase [Brucepastera parasyntrophica]